MIRSALLLCAAFLLATAFACAPALAPPPLFGGGPSALSWPLANCDAVSFANAVQMAQPFPLLTTQAPAANGAVQRNMWTDLQAAFAMAPPFFQKQLCDLNGVYVSGDSDSWGFRNPNTGQKFIAVTQDLWNDTPDIPGTSPARAAAIPYATFENRILKALLEGWTGPQHPLGPFNPSDSARTVLAALAHEYGHVLWYDTYVPNYGKEAHFEDCCSDGTTTFYTGSWENPTTNEPPPSYSPGSRWRFFGDIAGTKLVDDVDVRVLQTSVPAPGKPDTHGAGKMLHRIYRLRPPYGQGTGRWAGLFAAFSPQEDFVETFKLFVLRKAPTAPLISLKIHVPIFLGTPADADIPYSCSSRPVLQSKLACFQNRFCADADPLTQACGFGCAPKP